MLFFLLSFLSFILLLFKALDAERRFRIPAVKRLRICRLLCSKFFRYPSAMPARKANAREEPEMTILDLPELALELILEKLPPAGLGRMACVSSSLRDRCRSDHLWERHMREKWGRLIGPAARREWEWCVSTRKESSSGVKEKSWIGLRLCGWWLSWFSSRVVVSGKPRSFLPAGSTMSWFLALESGRSWFPAQVYNRENGHVGFMLSCYDAEVSYDRLSDTFNARYPPHGRRAINIEEGVPWDRLRKPPIDTPSHDLHASDCLDELRPGNHIEIQWRKNKEFPYGWWYGVVGHLDSCDGDEHYCHCHNSDTVILEFNHYTPGSRWRQTVVNRNNHKEVGNDTDGFYGGIRKLHGKDEISAWRRLWPSEVLE